MLNIAICDDDDLIAHQIESVLHNIGDEENVKIDTDVFYSGNDLVREISSGKKFDLIYMDIQMENGDGITAAKNIRKKDEDVMIIFHGYSARRICTDILHVRFFSGKVTKIPLYSNILKNKTTHGV